MSNKTNITTRLQARYNKPQSKVPSTSKRGQIDPSTPKTTHRPNTSVLNIVYESDDDVNKDTQDNIIIDLREKLASQLSINEGLTAKEIKLNEEIRALKIKLKHSEETTKHLMTTIEKSMCKHIYRDIGIQTAINMANSTTQTAVYTVDSNTQTETENTKPRIIKQNSLSNKTKQLNDSPKISDINSEKNKVLLLADCHGRHFSGLLNNILPKDKFLVEVVFKPNAPFEQVVNCVQNLTKSFTRQDYVIIMAGTTNALGNGCIKPELINRTLSCLSKTNVILTTIPYWRSRKVLNKIINNINISLSQSASINEHVEILDTNSIIDQKYLAQKNNYINFKGKQLISYKIKKIVLNESSNDNGPKENQNRPVKTTISDKGIDLQQPILDNNSSINTLPLASKQEGVSFKSIEKSNFPKTQKMVTQENFLKTASPIQYRKL